MAELVFIIILSFVNTANGGMEGNIVGGQYAKLADFPHSAFLFIERQTALNETRHFMCGASVLNQVILLTAAHCVEKCKKAKCDIAAHVGNENKNKGYFTQAKSIHTHEKYDAYRVTNDIGLVRLSAKLKFCKYVKRVVLMKQPPYRETAYVAGWGLVDEYNTVATFIKSAKQRVWTRKACLKYIKKVPEGAICAGEMHGNDYANRGDSGSALVVRKYIQIGIVSFKMPNISQSLVVYTDIGYHYNWIRQTANMIFCNKNKVLGRTN